MTTAQQTNERRAMTIVEGSYRFTPVEKIASQYNLPTGTERVLITANYRDVYDSRRDLKDVERGPVTLVDLPRTAQLLSQRGFNNLRYRAA